MPILLYLDTSDYINFFNSSANVEVEGVLDKLLSFVDAGEVDVGYSLFTVSEFIKPSSRNYLEDRREKGRFLKRITKGQAFPHVPDLVKGATFPNKGIWLPLKIIDDLSAKNIIESAFAEVVAELGLNRSGTRRAKAILRTKGVQTPAFITAKNGWKMEIPASLREAKLIEGLFAGKMSPRVFDQKLFRWASNPEHFAEIFYMYSGSEDVVERFWGESINNINSAICAGRENRKAVSELGKGRLEISKTAKLMNLTEGSAVLAKPFKLPPFDFSKLEGLVGSGRVRHFESYARYMIRTDRRFNRSDLFDLLHLIYAYDCDLFRCDAPVAEAVKGVAAFKGKLVTRLIDLPMAIEKKIVSKS